MTVSHIPDDQLERFLFDSMESEEAILVAEHIDDCAICSARARGLDPLQSAFAACSDPPIPERLTQEVLADPGATSTTSPGRFLLACIAAAIVIIGVSVVGSIGALELSARGSAGTLAGSMGVASPISVFVWMGLGVFVSLIAGAIAIGRVRS